MVDIFISHRHADHDAADKIKKLMQDLNIPSDDIFMSSEARNGVPAGEPIPDVIIQKIQDSDFFILVYTYRGEDWSYCTYELGLAVADNTKNTTVVVLSISGDTPSMVKHNKFIDLRSEDEIKEFVRSCCEKGDFLIPDDECREQNSGLIEVLSNIDIEIRDGKAESFQAAIQEHIHQFNMEQPVKHRMDHIVLEFSQSAVKYILDNKYSDENGDLIAENAIVNQESDDHSVRIFGLNNLSSGLNLKMVLDTWVSERSEFLDRDLEEKEIAWIQDLLMDLWRAVKGLNSRPSTNWFAGTDEEIEGRNFQLLVVRSERQNDGAMHLGLYVYRYRHNG